MRVRLTLPLANLGLNALAALAILATNQPALRDLAAAVIVFGTGFAVVPLLRLRDLALEALLIMMMSIVILICVAQLVTYIAFFSWRPCELILLAITLVGSVLQLLLAPREMQTRRPAPPRRRGRRAKSAKRHNSAQRRPAQSRRRAA